MNRNVIIDENTIYEIDPECMRRKNCPQRENFGTAEKKTDWPEDSFPPEKKRRRVGRYQP